MDLGERSEEAEVSERDSDQVMDEGAGAPRVFIPGKTKYDGSELLPDHSAYVFLYQLQAGAPCLSFDVIPDTLGYGRDDFPLTCYLVSGTERGQPNFINVMKLYNMHKTQKEEEDEDSDEEESEDEDERPDLELVTMQHDGGVNRLRVQVVGDKIYSASWSDKGFVYVYDITEQRAIVDDADAAAKYDSTKMTIVHTVKRHLTEGFAIDWSKPAKGFLATGDSLGTIFISKLSTTHWTTELSPLTGHTDSVEDIQWSPVEDNVLASCSVDRTLRIWCTKEKPEKANILTVPEAHNRDINVINWNTSETHLLASGGDDGIIKIWDLRMFKSKPVIAQGIFRMHRGPITSVEWNPLDSSVLAASGEDNQITIWDFSVEHEEGAQVMPELADVPEQLLFQHCGQTDIKELHWHPQLPGVLISTAKTDFNIFRTISV